jgi:hypothetical protein
MSGPVMVTYSRQMGLKLKTRFGTNLMEGRDDVRDMGECGGSRARTLPNVVSGSPII